MTSPKDVSVSDTSNKELDKKSATDIFKISTYITKTKDENKSITEEAYSRLRNRTS